jgi:hypothetical protein
MLKQVVILLYSIRSTCTCTLSHKQGYCRKWKNNAATAAGRSAKLENHYKTFIVYRIESNQFWPNSKATNNGPIYFVFFFFKKKF